MGMAITAVDIAAAAITTDGTGAEAITNGVIIAVGKPSLQFGLAIPLPGRRTNCSGANGSRPHGAAGSALIER